MRLFQKIKAVLQTGRYAIEYDMSIEDAGQILFENIIGGLQTGIIKINPVVGDRVLTLIHETLHIIYPNLTEYESELKSLVCYNNLKAPEERWLMQYLIEHSFDIPRL